MGIESISDADLMALKGGDLSKVSDAGLMALKGTPQPSATAQSAPEQKPLTTMQRIGMGAAKGLFGGPLGAVIGAGNAAMDIGNEGITKLGYDAGGKVTDIAAGIGVSPETSAKAGFAANVAVQAVPAVLAGKLATAASPLMEAGARRLMQSAVKPNLAARVSGDAPRAINTMLEKGINATAGGVEATQSKVSAMEDEMSKILAQSPATVDKTKVANNVQSALDKVKLDLGRANSEAEIIKAKSDFMNHPALAALGNDIPVSLANKMKQAFYKELTSKAYIPGQPLSAYDKGQKALASGLRTEVGNAEPAIVPTLADQAELLNVLKVLKPRVAVEGNKNILGLGILAPSMERVAVWMLDRYPWFKSMLARASYSGAERIPQAVVGTTVAASSGLASLQRQGNQ